MAGHHCARRFNWDCHGLPVEFEIDKSLGISTKDDALNLSKATNAKLLPNNGSIGVAARNHECRPTVTRCVGEWETAVTRMWHSLRHWVDFKDDPRLLLPLHPAVAASACCCPCICILLLLRASKACCCCLCILLLLPLHHAAASASSCCCLGCCLDILGCCLDILAGSTRWCGSFEPVLDKIFAI